MALQSRKFSSSSSGHREEGGSLSKIRSLVKRRSLLKAPSSKSLLPSTEIEIRNDHDTGINISVDDYDTYENNISRFSLNQREDRNEQGETLQKQFSNAISTPRTPLSQIQFSLQDQYEDDDDINYIISRSMQSFSRVSLDDLEGGSNSYPFDENNIHQIETLEKNLSLGNKLSKTFERVRSSIKEKVQNEENRQNVLSQALQESLSLDECFEDTSVPTSSLYEDTLENPLCSGTNSSHDSKFVPIPMSRSELTNEYGFENCQDSENESLLTPLANDLYSSIDGSSNFNDDKTRPFDFSKEILTPAPVRPKKNIFSLTEQEPNIINNSNNTHDASEKTSGTDCPDFNGEQISGIDSNIDVRDESNEVRGKFDSHDLARSRGNSISSRCEYIGSENSYGKIELKRSKGNSIDSRKEGYLTTSNSERSVEKNCIDPIQASKSKGSSVDSSRGHDADETVEFPLIELRRSKGNSVGNSSDSSHRFDVKNDSRYDFDTYELKGSRGNSRQNLSADEDVIDSTELKDSEGNSIDPTTERNASKDGCDSNELHSTIGSSFNEKYGDENEFSVSKCDSYQSSSMESRHIFDSSSEEYNAVDEFNGSNGDNYHNSRHECSTDADEYSQMEHVEARDDLIERNECDEIVPGLVDVSLSPKKRSLHKKKFENQMILASSSGGGFLQSIIMKLSPRKTTRFGFGFSRSIYKIGLPTDYSETQRCPITEKIYIENLNTGNIERETPSPTGTDVESLNEESIKAQGNNENDQNYDPNYGNIKNDQNYDQKYFLKLSKAYNSVRNVDKTVTVNSSMVDNASTATESTAGGTYGKAEAQKYNYIMNCFLWYWSSKLEKETNIQRCCKFFCSFMLMVIFVLVYMSFSYRMEYAEKYDVIEDCVYKWCSCTDSYTEEIVNCLRYTCDNTCSYTFDSGN